MRARRARLRLARSGPAAALSHLEHVRALRDVFRRTGWPLEMSGKTPKAAFGPAIPAGYVSEAEYADVSFAAPYPTERMGDDLGRVLPEGYAFRAARAIPALFPSLEELANAAAYDAAGIPRPPAETAERLREMMARKEFTVVKRKGDRDVAIDARPLIRDASADGGGARLLLRSAPGRHVRPEHVLRALLSLGDDEAGRLSIRRLALFAELRDGRLIEL